MLLALETADTAELRVNFEMHVMVVGGWLCDYYRYHSTVHSVLYTGNCSV
jgi:hypothetical protein